MSCPISTSPRGIAARLLIDRLDNSNVPRRGRLLVLDGFRSDPELGADLPFQTLRGSYSRFASRGAYTFLLRLDGGTSLGGDVPAYEEFLVGGLFSLSGFGERELRGQYFGVGRLGYLHRLFELPPALGSAIDLGGWIEAGNIWQTSATFGEDLAYAATLAAAVDTRLGPHLPRLLPRRRERRKVLPDSWARGVSDSTRCSSCQMKHGTAPIGAI